MKRIKIVSCAIESEGGYRTVLAETERLIALDLKPSTADADRLDLFAMLVEAYEKEHFLTA